MSPAATPWAALTPTLRRLQPDAPAALLDAVRALLEAGEAGHTALPLAGLGLEGVPPGPILADADAAGSASAVVVRVGGLLQLARVRAQERALAERLRALAEPVEAPEIPAAALLPDARGHRPEGAQIEAVAAALRARLLVLAGGPGTGKTTTVVRLLLALELAARARGEAPPTVRLLAPTGKAAARLGASVADQRDALVALHPELAGVGEGWPRVAWTLHRALGAGGDPLRPWRHGPHRPWSESILVVDEASMVDEGLLARTLGAMRPDARLILVGDPDQLPAVGPGAALADLASLPASHPIAAATVRLTRSHRFRDDGGVGVLARAVRSGSASEVAAAWAAARPAPVEGVEVVPASSRGAVLREVVGAWLDGLGAGRGVPLSPEQRLDVLDRARVLAPVREGAWGVAALNDRILEAWIDAGAAPPDARGALHWEGRPILIERNEPALGLANGDTGVVARGADGRLWAWFRGGEGEPLRRVALGRLPEHSTAFAMTVHKSQGSEFDHVVLAVGEEGGPTLTRELIYTALTRARRRVTLVGDPAVVEAAVTRSAERRTGLRAACGA